MVSTESLNTFQNIYFREYGISLSDDEAYQLASNLVNLYRVVYLEPNEKQEKPES